MLTLGYVTCGGGTIESMNSFLPYLVSLIIRIIQVGVLVILVVLGMIDLLKATAAQKEDEIKKAQNLFFKRLVAGLLVFFVVMIVEFVFNLLGKGIDDKENVWNCASCFISGPSNYDGGTAESPVECRK